jgi:hypothetical protein
MVLLAAFQALLSRYAGTEDVVVGTPVAGRTCGPAPCPGRGFARRCGGSRPARTSPELVVDLCA